MEIFLRRPLKWTPMQLCLASCETCIHHQLFLCFPWYILCFLLHRDSRQDLQSIQWLHQWQGAADCIQHTDGSLCLHALPCPASLQLSLWKVWWLRLEERGWARTKVWGLGVWVESEMLFASHQSYWLSSRYNGRGLHQRNKGRWWWTRSCLDYGWEVGREYWKCIRIKQYCIIL